MTDARRLRPFAGPQVNCFRARPFPLPGQSALETSRGLRRVRNTVAPAVARRLLWIGIIALAAFTAELALGQEPAAVQDQPAGSEQSSVEVRAAAHGGFTRVVYVLPKGTALRQTRVGDLLVLRFAGVGQVPGLREPPAPLLSGSGGQNVAALGIPRGLRVHVWRIDQRVIVDIFPPEAPSPPPVAPAPDHP
jgi:hypothetical protein